MQHDIVEKRELLKRKFREMQQPKKDQVGAEPQFHSNVDITPEQHCWSGKTFSDLLFIEIFAGTARLSSAMREQQFETLAIDKTSERSRAFRIAIFDLTDPEQSDELEALIKHEAHRVIAVHLAPACGTASKAREKRLHSLQRQGFKIPKPLRSREQPMGLDGLSGLDKCRTEQANMVYERTAQVVDLCNQLNILCSVENPQNSLFWEFPDIKAATKDGVFTVFHSCMHGGRRKKLTQWWANKDTYTSLGLICHDEHTHAPWTPQMTPAGLVFPTAEEAAYPVTLCKRVAAILVQLAISCGANQPLDLEQQLKQRSSTSHRWILDMLPRGKKFKPLVSEFSSYIHVLVKTFQDVEQSVFFKQQLKGTKLTSRRLQVGCVRVVDGVPKVWEEGKTTKQWDLSWCSEDIITEKMVEAELCTLGTPRDPWDFVDRALEVGHPRSMAIHLSDGVERMLVRNFCEPPHVVVATRAKFLEKWTNRCRELQDAENEMQAGLDVHIREVLKGKRLLLLGEILNSLNYPDKTLVEDLKQGFQLTGWISRSGVFPQAMKRPERSVEAALNLAKGVNKSIIKQVQASKDDDLTNEVWEATKLEIQKGWVFVDESCDPGKHLLGKRFGLNQRDKMRLIDDCSIGGFNGTCGTSEKLKVHSIDEMAAYLAWVINRLGPDHPNDLVGKTYDLKSAYKQFALRGADRDLLRVATWDSEQQRVAYLGLNALPFGAVGSVSAFLRISIALWYIGIVGLDLCWSAFFDDFTLISRECHCNSAAVSAEALFTLLGIKYATEGNKSVAFSKTVKSLGVVLGLDNIADDDGCTSFSIGHTDSRVRELSTCIADILAKGSISSKEAERLRGRMQWFETFAFGRVANQPMRVLSKLASSNRSSLKLTAPDVSSLTFLKDRVLTAPPVRISKISMNTVLIFTDGSCEGEDSLKGGVGGILINEWGAAISCFSEEVPSYIMEDLKHYSSHPIFELEILPVLCGILAWSAYLSSKQCVFYLDNEAAQGALVKGSSETSYAASMLRLFTEFEMNLQIKTWIARVPTSSNPADKPSRGDLSEMEQRHVIPVQILWKEVWDQVSERLIVNPIGVGGRDLDLSPLTAEKGRVFQDKESLSSL